MTPVQSGFLGLPFRCPYCFKICIALNLELGWSHVVLYSGLLALRYRGGVEVEEGGVEEGRGGNKEPIRCTRTIALGSPPALIFSD